jgi:hypothetical protein
VFKEGLMEGKGQKKCPTTKEMLFQQKKPKKITNPKRISGTK